MTREIKFRAWNGTKMLYPDDIDLRTSQKLFYRPLSSLLGDSNDYNWMQYTGIKDKNGVEIYEGDIVMHRKLDRAEDQCFYGIGEIIKDDEPDTVIFENCGFFPFCGWIEEAIKDLEYEVIGNIYERKTLKI